MTLAITPVIVSEKLQTKWNNSFKYLHNGYSRLDNSGCIPETFPLFLRYGYCSCLWKQPSTSGELRATISILCTERKKWSKFLRKLVGETQAEDKKRAMCVFLILLILYSSSDPNAFSMGSIEKKGEKLLNELKPDNVDIIPELVLAHLISINTNSGDPEENSKTLDSCFGGSAEYIVKNFVEATVIRDLKKLETLTSAPYRIKYKAIRHIEIDDDEKEVKEVKEEEICYASIDSDILPELSHKWDGLSRECYNEFKMNRVNHWSKGECFWRFIEKNIQGSACRVPKGNIDLQIQKYFRGNFQGADVILWRKLHPVTGESKKTTSLREHIYLKTRTEGKLICKECGGELRFQLWRTSLNVPIDDEKGENELIDFVENGERQSLDKYDCFVWNHKVECCYSPLGRPDDFFIVRYNDRLYFPDMSALVPYKKIRCYLCKGCWNKYKGKFQQDENEEKSVSKDGKNQDEKIEKKVSKDGKNKKTIRCVWPNRTCGCGEGLGTDWVGVSVPNCFELKEYQDRSNYKDKNQQDDANDIADQLLPGRNGKLKKAIVDFLSREPYRILQNNIRGKVEFREFEKFTNRICRDEQDFNKSLRQYWSQQRRPFNQEDFIKGVKKTLIVEEFSWWYGEMACAANEDGKSNRSANPFDSFEEYWKEEDMKGRRYLKNCWKGEFEKEQIQNWVKAFC